MSCKQKCKCKKSVLVVARIGDNDFSQFLDQLDPKVRRCYVFVLLNVDYLRDEWVDTVQKKLKCMCKKYGCKPDIVSALYNTDAEMQLARLSCNFCKIYSSASTTDALRLVFGEQRFDFMIRLWSTTSGKRWVAADNGILYDKYEADEVYVPQGGLPTGRDSTYVDDVASKAAEGVMLVDKPSPEPGRRRLVTSVEGIGFSDLVGGELSDLGVAQLVDKGNRVRMLNQDSSNEILITAPSGEAVYANLATDAIKWENPEAKNKILLAVGGTTIGLNGDISQGRLVLIGSSLRYWLEEF